MRYTKNIYLAGTGTWLPGTQPMAQAIEAGLVGEDHRDLGYQAIAIDESGTAPVDMAISAARQAISRSGVEPADFGLHLHASVWFQGLDCWAPAAYVANATVGAQAIAFSIDQRSAGGMGAMHLAAAYLDAGTVANALVTTGDRFTDESIDRYNSYVQAIWGDGGTAVVLSTQGGFAELLSSVIVSDNSLERWDRGATEFAAGPLLERPAAIHKRFAQHAATPDVAAEVDQWAAGVLRTRDLVLAEAGIGQHEITRAVLPFVHRGGGQAELHDLLGIPEELTLWQELGSQVGHLGAGDPFAGLDKLLADGTLKPGDHVLLYTVGVGFTFSAAVLRITAPQL
ncbi:3-oxoacyl-[acyl-carrier-protein] synthase-3 [Kitasatospora sp. MAP12-15]|uniref:ketoacyl-ACP synthase III family protein n=1 Tax=unclassified Kitasatospora TaxID=2633591 RepID=UPI0024757A84|nr:ketoacyl-ACP synthase III family protein [Kitasatospora sp. MAP12-44]MDH6110594.1 3-oxoacyl-[acyl-carrier-protein] synthase-3 [Kitasatospora sp. MAP12-44]